MTKENLIFGGALLIFLFTFRIVLADPIFYDVCVDPGHGGPGATKYGWNGEDYGSYGLFNRLSEQWINLQVGFALRDSIQQPGFLWKYAIMTRETEQAENMPADYLPRLWFRTSLVNHANNGNPVYQFISIHHNGLPEGSEQGTEVFWSSIPQTDSGQFRSVEKKLAQKILLQLLNKWGYQNRCSTHCLSHDISCCESQKKYLVLWNTIPVSALSEASDISFHSWEEELFDDYNLVHEKEEAGALYHAWRSYVHNGGIVTVANHWISGNGGLVEVDDVVRNSPFVTCWEAGEWHGLVAAPIYNFDGEHVCIFQYWKEVETGMIWLNQNAISVAVPVGESTHTYLAYYQGGHYFTNVYSPYGGEEWLVGDTGPIIWHGTGQGTSVGVDSTTLIDVFLDRNSGYGGFSETLFTGIQRKDNWSAEWQVIGPASSKCRVKVIAHDCVGNTASDTSNYDFTIRFPNIAGDANSDGSVTVADVVYLVSYLFKHGPPPDPLWKGDANGDCEVTVSDIVYMISYFYKGGNPPVVCNPTCWPCLQALTREDDKPYTKDPSFLEKIFRGDKESTKKIDSDYNSESAKPFFPQNPDSEKTR